jgi:hypothetical protein
MKNYEWDCVRILGIGFVEPAKSDEAASEKINFSKADYF